jgi:hypothetical protein
MYSVEWESSFEHFVKNLLLIAFELDAEGQIGVEI